MLGRNKKQGPFLVLSGSTELFLCPPTLLQPLLPDPDLGSTADSGAAAGHVHRGLLPVPCHAAASPTHLEFLKVRPPALSNSSRAWASVYPVRWCGQAPRATGLQWGSAGRAGR